MINSELDVKGGSLDKSGELGTDEALLKELLSVRSKLTGIVAIPVLITGIVYGYFIYGDIPMIYFSVWMALYIVITFIRVIIFTRLPTYQHISLEKRINIIVFLSLINGIIQGSSLTFFPYFSLTERSIQTLIQLGLIAGAVATTSGYKPFFLSFTIPVSLSLSVMWSITPFEGSNYWIQISITVLIILFFAVQYRLANNYFGFFKDSIKIRSEQKMLNAKLNEALEQAVLASESKTRFLASASHDLRQPIHTLQLFSTALSMRKLDNKSAEIAKHMETAIDSLAAQMTSLLDISKLDAGLVPKNIISIDIVSFLENNINSNKLVANKKGLDLNFVTEFDEANARTDHDQLMRIINNLVSNALRYTDEGNVTIELSKSDNKWLISITDTGIGIPEIEKERIFEEFYQVENKERDRTKGLGLGLAIVRRLCESLEIELKLSSQLNVGTRVELYLEMDRFLVPIQIEKTESYDISGLRILCLDDELEVRIALDTLLSELGCFVFLTKTIDEALDVASNSNINIFLADFRLAGKENGIDAVRRVRSVLPNIPAILISGDIEPERLRLASQAGLDILHKPVNVLELQQAIFNNAQL